MDFQDDAAEFSSEDVDTIVKNAITGCLTDVMYNPKKVSAGDDRVFYKALVQFHTYLTRNVSFKDSGAQSFCNSDLYAVMMKYGIVSGFQHFICASRRYVFVEKAMLRWVYTSTLIYNLWLQF